MQCARLGHDLREIGSSWWPLNRVDVCIRCGKTEVELLSNIPIGYFDTPPPFYSVKGGTKSDIVHFVSSMGHDYATTACSRYVIHKFDEQSLWVEPNVVDLLGEDPTCKQCLRAMRKQENSEPARGIGAITSHTLSKVHHQIYRIIWKELWNREWDEAHALKLKAQAHEN